MSKIQLPLMIKDAQINYAALFEPVPDYDKKSYVFKVLALVEHDSKAAQDINRVVEEIMGKSNQTLMSPIRNFHNASYITEGFIGVNAKAKLDEKRIRRGGPIVCDAKRNVITDVADAYSGCYGNIMTSFYVANGRICVGLSGVQITLKGPRLDGQATSADQLFEEVQGFEKVDETVMFDTETKPFLPDSSLVQATEDSLF